MKLSRLHENKASMPALERLQNLDISRFFQDNVKWDTATNPQSIKASAATTLQDFINGRGYESRVEYDHDDDCFIIKFSDIDVPYVVKPDDVFRPQDINIFQYDNRSKGKMIDTREHHRPNI